MLFSILVQNCCKLSKFQTVKNSKIFKFVTDSNQTKECPSHTTFVLFLIADSEASIFPAICYIIIQKWMEEMTVT